MSISPPSRQRKARDLNPHDPKVARFSKPARRAVSGYLPYVFNCQWTDRESNPDFRHARAVSSRWTISPFDSHSYSSSRRQSRISRSSLSLNRPLAFPIHRNDVHIVQRTFRRRFPAVFRRRFIVERRGIEPRLPGCKPSVFPLDQRPKIQEVRPGIEPGLPPYHSGVPPKHLQTICQK